MLFRVSRYALVTLILAITALGFLTDSASAAIVDLGQHSYDDLKATCNANGGTFTSSVSGSVYKCEGKRGTVTCGATGGCWGSCANCKSITAPNQLQTVLHGGGNVSANATTTETQNKSTTR
jgi:hypothetical protein